MVVSIKKTEVLNFYPKSVQEIKSSKYPKFILKFTSESCPPCRKLQAWLETEYKPTALVPIFHIKGSDGQEDVMNTLCTMYNIRTVPQMIFTDSSLTPLDTVSGFREDKIVELIQKHFS